MNPLLKMHNVVYKINQRTILNIPEFAVEENEIMGIMGPNGAGKSTLLKLLAFLDFPSEGNIEYKQKKIRKDNITLDVRRKFAIAMQQASLLNTTVYQNVAIGYSGFNGVICYKNHNGQNRHDRNRYEKSGFSFGHNSIEQLN